VAAKALADTGAVLAYLDRSDRWHSRCRAALTELRLPLVTSLAVLTELFHLVGDNPREVEAAWGFVRSGVLTVLPLSDLELADLEALMRRYRDRPMDLADATLVHLAERESVSTVFTIDHDDFETYRIGGRKRFRILPAR
jgi:predicted nucleic acid-binding protein